MSIKNLTKMFNPKVVAIYGASARVGSVGHALMDNIIGSGFDGIVYPVNPKRTNVLGVKAYNSIQDIPDQVDLVIIALQLKLLLQL